jgi:lipid-A-disaccharide synthase
VLRVPSVILANLVLGENVVPEFLQEECTPENLAGALESVMSDTRARRAQIDAFGRLDRIMEIGSTSPARKAAEIVLRHATEKRG